VLPFTKHTSLYITSRSGILCLKWLHSVTEDAIALGHGYLTIELATYGIERSI
jgi:hypothetical protein